MLKNFYNVWWRVGEAGRSVSYVWKIIIEGKKNKFDKKKIFKENLRNKAKENDKK